jgi:hypothetical protein
MFFEMAKAVNDFAEPFSGLGRRVSVFSAGEPVFVEIDAVIGRAEGKGNHEKLHRKINDLRRIRQAD